MNALVTDICAQVYPIALRSADTDGAIREILREHREVLIRCGLTDSWIDTWGAKDLGVTNPEWQCNIRIFTWWCCSTMRESDDEIVTALIADPRKAKTSHTGLFLSPTGEYLAFECSGRTPAELLSVAYKRIRDGLVDFNDDTREAALTNRWGGDGAGCGGRGCGGFWTRRGALAFEALSGLVCEWLRDGRYGEREGYGG